MSQAGFLQAARERRAELVLRRQELVARAAAINGGGAARAHQRESTNLSHPPTSVRCGGVAFNDTPDGDVMEPQGGRSGIRSPDDIARIARLEEEVLRLRARIADQESQRRLWRRRLRALIAGLLKLLDDGEDRPADRVVDIRVPGETGTPVGGDSFDREIAEMTAQEPRRRT